MRNATPWSLLSPPIAARRFFDRRGLRWFSRGFAGSVALLLLLADGGISGDELQCELAADHILTCCPELGSVPLSCVRSGCGGQMVPSLDETRAACLRAASCEVLRSSGVCDVSSWEAPMGCASPCNAKVPRCQ